MVEVGSRTQNEFPRDVPRGREIHHPHGNRQRTTKSGASVLAEAIDA